MIMCPGYRGEECDRIVTLEYDVETAKVVGVEGCPHILEYSEPELFDLAFDAFPEEELEQRRIPRRGRHVRKHLPTAVEEEGIDEYEIGGES
jgi:hypothetical protein